MTTLEKGLVAALAVVTTFSVSVVITTVKHIKREKQFLDDMQDKCKDIVDILNEEDEDEES